MEKKPIYGTDPEKILRLLSIGEDERDFDEAPVNPEDSPVTDRIRDEKQSNCSAASREDLIERLHTSIEGYRIIKVLGEGGMGIVYLAEQKYPVKRQVALKIIKPGMDSRRVLARFEAEQQTLAWLDHPNIAKVFDAGATETGCPFFVMEYVEGAPITEFCDRNRLSIRDRLSLLAVVCQAIQHAHQKGIIHRDIKPSNILIAHQDGQPMPKIIDFGVAKAMGEPLTECTLKTEDSQLLGTPEYMSPEQADMAQELIDTRSDVYSLGVLLYVLLAGSLPFDSDALRKGGIENIRRTIRETDPRTPSTRLMSLGREATKVAESRGTEISTLTKHLKKELEWIPLKAMRKDRSERYRSASELADDIENYLKGAPLIAGPPGTVYRLKKFIRQNAVLCGAVAAVGMTVLVGLAATTVLYLEAKRQAQISQAVSSFLRNDLIASVSPTRAMGREVTVRLLLDSIAESLETRFKDEPLVEASIRDTLGNTCRHLGDFHAAALHLERACQLYQELLDSEDPRTLNSMSGLIWVYLSQGRCIEAEKLAVRAFDISRRVFDEASKESLQHTNDLAFAYMATGSYTEAEKLFVKMLETSRSARGEEGEGIARAMNNLSRVYLRQGRYKESEQLFDEALELAKRVWGNEHPFTLANMSSRASVYAAQGRYAEAEDLCLRLLETHRRVVGEEHLYTLECMSVLGRVHIAQKDYQQAEDLFTRALEIARRRLREGHPRTLSFVNGLAVVHTRQEHCDKAQTLFDEALEGRRLELGDSHPQTLETINDFGVLRREQQRYEEAESMLRQALDGRRLKLGVDHPACFESMHELAALHMRQDRRQQAAQLLVKAAEGRLAKLGDKHPHTQESLSLLIDLYRTLGQPEEAQKWRARLLKRDDAEGLD